MNQKLLFSSALLVGIAGTQQALAQKKKVQDQKRPNVVFILADDLGFGDLSCYGQEKFETPNIDKLAQEGMRFTQCYSGTTVSAPSRSCLLTGTHSGHTAIRGNVELDPEGQFPLPADAQTIFHDFQNAGYKTGAFGKWGLGFIGSTGDPKKQGIDEFYGYNCQLLAHSYYPDHLWDNDKRVELEDNNLNVQYGKGTYSQDLIHGKALEYLDNMNPDEPFFMWYPTIIPHAELIEIGRQYHTEISRYVSGKTLQRGRTGQSRLPQRRLLFAVPSPCHFCRYGLPSGRLCRADHPKVKR